MKIIGSNNRRGNHLEGKKNYLGGRRRCCLEDRVLAATISIILKIISCHFLIICTIPCHKQHATMKIMQFMPIYMYGIYNVYTRLM